MKNSVYRLVIQIGFSTVRQPKRSIKNGVYRLVIEIGFSTVRQPKRRIKMTALMPPLPREATTEEKTNLHGPTPSYMPLLILLFQHII